ncbi:hypothetical protein PS659_00902 [Pseudomonas fluorescens]|uniref:Lipoprotein n=1 Tax=Pseudomonas fluorescens TaxID=294 RepID=A0A5E6Q959_PSEFL|nr:hypothetical protein PS659_00902 [Pseudomonas fluorescens]
MRRVLAMLLMFGIEGHALAGSCGAIDNQDQRRYCEARSGSGSCGGIDNQDLRNQCEALKH